MGIPNPTPGYPKFVDVEESIGTVLFTHPEIYHQGGAWYYNGNLPLDRCPSDYIVTSLSRSITGRIGTLIQKPARQGK